MHSLLNISPIDGRYSSQTAELQKYFSEFALIRYRIKVEVLYLIELSKAKFFTLPAAKIKKLHSLYDDFTFEQAHEVKNIEKTTNHDVKAVEYFIKAELKKLGLQKISEWVHFGLTSQDINNTAIPLLWKDAISNHFIPHLKMVLETLYLQSKEWRKVAMLARTHGQPASPTTLGKEWVVYIERIEKQLIMLDVIPFAAKFGGATGNFNAHKIAYPKFNWLKFAENFVNKTLGLERSMYTTQIEHYDMLAAQFDALKRINNILIDLSRDVWTYISMDYFKQKTKEGEVGSSAMPHKVNPIDFENAEGNLGIANALYEHLSAKLPISRLQRDLTDSTVLRNIGMPFSHSYIALNSILKGLHKLIIHEAAIKQDLDNNWAVVAEAIQTVLRRENYPQPYEALKTLTRGKSSINQAVIHEFIEGLKIDAKLKKELKAISPSNYTGYGI